jgi:hypothetical protein
MQPWEKSTMDAVRAKKPQPVKPGPPEGEKYPADDAHDF